MSDIIRFHEIIDSIETSINRPICSCELRILIYLYDNGPSPSIEVRNICASSTAKFYNAINKLRDIGILSIELNSESRMYRMTERFINMMDDSFATYKDWHSSPYENGMSAFSRRYSTAVSEDSRKFKIITFTCAYKIIRYIYDSGTISAGELCKLCNVSSATFYHTLASLHKDRIISCAKSGKDHRYNNYFLPESTMNLLDVNLQGIKRWYAHKTSSR